MRSKMFKKMLAGTLATTMVLGMSMTASAADNEGSGTGTGEFEGHVTKNVVAVTLPTASATTFAYKMDPEGLIAATDNAKYSGATFEEGANVYFQSATNTYTKDSAKLKVVNKGTADVDVTVKAEVADDTSVGMAASETFAADNKNAELYLGLNVANQPTAAVKKTGSADGAEVVVGLKGKSDNFEITYDETDGYGYTAKAGIPDTAWNSFEFGLTGACNPNGDYSADALAASDVTVTWSYAERESDSTAPELAENAVADAAPSVESKTYIMTAGQDVLVDISLGAGDLAATGVSSVSYVVSGKTYSFASGEFNVEDGKLVLNHSKTDVFVNSNVKNREITILFNDAAKTTGKVTLTTAD